MLAKVVLLIFAAATVVFGHSHLANPLPTRRLDCRVGNGRQRACHGPCPPMDRYGEATGVSQNRPAQTWRRGERRTISWHRNNHGKGESGFVRFSLVPVDKMMNKASHARFTFQISCWSSGIHKCHSRHRRVCGNDAEGKAYKVAITVPTAYPDGIYVFGWAWYGGGDYRGKSFFGDYYSCSFIRINGGKAVSAQSRPVFHPGQNQKSGDSCMSATDRVGICWREPCHRGPVKPMKPRGLPNFIWSSDLGFKAQSGGGRAKPLHKKNNRGVNAGARGRKGRINASGIEVYDLRFNRARLMRGKNFSVKLSDYRSGFTLGLKVSGDISKVIFQIRGQRHEETAPPYTVNGNQGARMNRFHCRNGEKVHFTADVYGRDGQGKRHKYNLTCM